MRTNVIVVYLRVNIGVFCFCQQGFLCVDGKQNVRAT
jgi:hypothetical protein